MKLYGYKNCGTCKKAKAWLDERGIAYEWIDIVTRPPSEAELVEVLRRTELPFKKLFNTTGQLYRERGLKDKVPQMAEAEALAMLAAEGKLIKRPIAFGDDKATVGFKETEYEEVWG